MTTVRIQTDATEPIIALVRDGSLDPLTGKTDILVSIWRLSDGFFYDFDDDTFKTSGWTTRQEAMSEVDATNAAGEYQYDWDTSNIVSPVADDTYFVRVEQSPGTDAKNLPQVGELKIGQWVDDSLRESYMGEVVIDTVNGVAGTDFPTGTPYQPSNNLANALTIAGNIGVRKFKVAGSITLTGALTNWTIEGVAANNLVAIVNLGGQNVAGTEFCNVALTGTSTGFFTGKCCEFFGTLNGIQGFFRDCSFLGTITPAANAGIWLFDCQSGVAGLSTPVLDLTNHTTTGSVNLRGYSGGIALRNLSSAGFNGSLEFIAGQVQLEATLTAGTVAIRGITKVTDLSAGTTIVTEAALARTPIQELILNDSTPFPGAHIDADISSRAQPGDEMNLADDAITLAKFDETTAWPLEAADTGATEVARTGADGDTLETISDQIDGVAVPGSEMNLADNAITLAKFDETTAWPLEAADTGATEVARTGADGDTLETLSDQVDLTALEANVEGHVTTALNTYDPPTKAELDAAVAPLALEANVEGHVTSALNTYDPPTKAELDTAEANIIAEVDANEVKIDALQTDLTVIKGAGFDSGDSLKAAGDERAVIEGKIDDISNVTRFRTTAPSPFEVPSSGSVDYRIHVNLEDTTGNPEDPDADTITVGVTNQVGTDRSANLSSTTMVKESTGRYRVDYTVASTHPLEQLMFTFTYDEGGVTFVKNMDRLVTDAAEVGYTATDRSRDDQIALETPQILADTNDIQTRLPAALVGGRMDSDVGNIQAAALSQINTELEVTSGHGAGSWQTGGAGLTAQQVRDAMKLAPTGGAPAAGSVDEHLDEIETDTSTMEPIVSTNLDATISSIATAIGLLNDLSVADVQTAMTNQGYTGARAILLDNLDMAISALNDLSQADVQAAMTSQGYTTVRAALLDNLDDAISNVITAIATAESNIRGGPDTLDALSDQLDGVQADLDDPNQYKADVSALALETTALAIRAKTDNLPPDPTSETNATTNKTDIIAEVDANETKIDAIQTDLTATATDITLIKKIETGRWKVDDVTNTMTFYDPVDDVTPILVFDLKDLAGLPSAVNIFERVPV